MAILTHVVNVFANTCICTNDETTTSATAASVTSSMAVLGAVRGSRMKSANQFIAIKCMILHLEAERWWQVISMHASNERTQLKSGKDQNAVWKSMAWLPWTNTLATLVVVLPLLQFRNWCLCLHRWDFMAYFKWSLYRNNVQHFMFIHHSQPNGLRFFFSLLFSLRLLYFLLLLVLSLLQLLIVLIKFHRLALCNLSV